MPTAKVYWEDWDTSNVVYGYVWGMWWICEFKEKWTPVEDEKPWTSTASEFGDWEFVD